MQRAVDGVPGDTDEADDRVLITQLGAGSDVVRDVLASGRPRVVTEYGVAVAVIVDARTFGAMRADAAARDLLLDLQQATAEADAGDLVDHAEVLGDLRHHFAGRVPEEVLRQLDGS